MRTFSGKQVQRTLNKYDTVIEVLEITAKHSLSIVQLKDPYGLLERLVDQEAAGQQAERFPYWAEIWPASLGLAIWLINNREPPAGWTLELGCGLGVVGIALARAGWCIEASDYVEDALVFAQHNARHNYLGGRHRVCYLDWRHPVGGKEECIVASDVVYEKKDHKLLARLIDKRLGPKGHFYLSDPQRSTAIFFSKQMESLGFHRNVQTQKVQWKELEHSVDIYEFIR